MEAAQGGALEPILESPAEGPGGSGELAHLICQLGTECQNMGLCYELQPPIPVLEDGSPEW